MYVNGGKNLDKIDFIEKPVFICGHRRSGTTFFLSLLENHPELLVYPTDSGFFYAFYPIYESSNYSNKEKIEQIVNFCIKNMEDILTDSFPDNILKEIDFSVKAFRDEFRKLAKNTQCTSRELLISVIRAYKEQYAHPKKPLLWVEKTTSSEIYAADALKWFPHAKFIHVLRDPRDNWASLKSGWEVRFKYQNDTIGRLMHSMIERGKFGFELAVINQKRFGKKKYKIIRYEDLVGNTKSVMEDVCRFLDISLSRKVLTPTICGKAWKGNNYSKTNFKGPSSYNVSRWKERITEQEAKLLEYHFEDFMKKFDYPVFFDLAEKVNAAVEHYKWYNYAQIYSYSSTRSVKDPKQKRK